YSDMNGNGTLCTDIDECATGLADCRAPAICTNTQGGYTCNCPPGTRDQNGDGTVCVPVLGENCGADAIDVSASALPIGFQASTAGANADLAYGADACPGDAAGAGAASSDRVYRLTPTVSGAYDINLTSMGFDASLYV